MPLKPASATINRPLSMKCKLCMEEKELHNSHIIPEFLYKTLYDEKHRFYEISTDKNIKNRHIQKGLRERLLCKECEQHFSKNERYASLVLNGGQKLIAFPEPPMVHFKSIHYAKFKLFALSILWRAGVSSDPVFSDVKLGCHENLLREMLLNELPGRQAQYPFLLVPVMHGGDVVESLIVPPEKTKVGEQPAYIFVFGGLMWVYIVSGHPPPKAVLDASISESGQLTMLPMQIKDIKYILNFAKKFVELGKF